MIETLAQEAAAQQVDGEARRLAEFEAVVREHQGMVFSLAYYFLRDAAAAEELAQESS